MHDEHVEETSEGKTPIHPIQRTRQRRDQQFEGIEEQDYQVFEQYGGLTLRSHKENLRHPTSSSSSTQWEQHNDWNNSWNSTVVNFFSILMLFSLAGNLNSLPIDGGVHRYTCRTLHFYMHSHCTERTTCAPWLKELAGLKFELCAEKHSLIHASCFTLRLTAH